jgi:hypothetical protein
LRISTLELIIQTGNYFVVFLQFIFNGSNKALEN